MHGLAVFARWRRCRHGVNRIKRPANIHIILAGFCRGDRAHFHRHSGHPDGNRVKTRIGRCSPSEKRGLPFYRDIQLLLIGVVVLVNGVFAEAICE